ncbi:unnamed protein product [Ophioblennius macclurei]
MSEAEPSPSATPDATDKEKDGERVSPDGGAKQRVLKEVGLTSSAFIGPAFPPPRDGVVADIEDSLSEFYKELQEIESPDGAQTGHVETPQDAPEGGVAEVDGSRKQVERRHRKSHRALGEPYRPRAPRPERLSADSEQKRWNGAPNVDAPPNFASPGPPFLQQGARPPPFVNPGSQSAHRDPSFQSRFPSFPGFPPPDVSGRPIWDVYDEERRSFHSRRNEDRHSDCVQRFDSLDDVWERCHHPPSHDHAQSERPTLVLILMRGLPGSGKSTRARELLSTGPSGVVLSTDDYFAHREGYRYESRLLGAAHQWNQRRAKDALFDGRSPVIIDNTNLQAWEMKPYVQMALERGYDVHFCEPETSWKFDAQELERRNKHGVPQEKILQMLDRFSSPISVDVVLNSQEPSHVHQRHRPDGPHPPPTNTTYQH